MIGHIDINLEVEGKELFGMGMYLNSSVPYDSYKMALQDTYFVDKSALISELIPALDKRNRFFCMIRPRRFGKTVMANMVGAYFGKTEEKTRLFDHLIISKMADYETHLNQYDVIYIDFSRLPKDCVSYQQYIDRIQNGISTDLMGYYPELGLSISESVWDNLQRIYENTRNKFIFVMDEWDAVFHMSFVSKTEQQEFLSFLKNLLKDQAYVKFAYMTGVLPIAKYSSGSELNMFVEYNMATTKKFSEYFGFLDSEVDTLYHIYLHETINPDISREELRIWYDGYYTARGEQLYNPRSVVLALTDNQLGNYWTSSGPYDELFYYIQNNIEAVREDLVLMVSGEHIDAGIQQYAAVSMELNSKEQIYSAMVIYGLLSYAEGKVFIPNKELMNKFNELLMSKNSLGYVYNLAKKSEQMLQATLAADTETMEEILQFAHDTESPILSYNNEVELSAVVNLCYLAARDSYRIEREDRAGKGYVDFIFYPERTGRDCMILELKVDKSPEDAINQIKDKNYALRFKGTLGKENANTGRILAVGISYSKETKEHHCKVEVLKN